MRTVFLSTMLLASSAITAQQPYLVAGTYTKGESKGIYLYRFDPATGESREVSTTFTMNPSYLAFDEANDLVFAVSENGDGQGAVNAYRFHADGDSLSLLNTQPSNGDAPCYVAVDKSSKWVAVGNYSGGNFSVYPVQEDGALGTAVQVIRHTGSSANKDRQEKAHVHSTVFSPDQKYLAVADLGTDKIYFYPFNAGNDKPVTEKAVEVKVKPGSGPRHIVFHPTLPFVYVITELKGEVLVYSFNNGKAKLQQTISAHSKGYMGDIGSAAIKISNDGQYLYASNRGGSNTVAVFAIDAKNGRLSTKEIVPSGGKTPRDFALDPSGNFLLTTGSSTDEVSIFRRNPQTGLLEKTDKQLSIPQPVFLGFMEK